MDAAPFTATEVLTRFMVDRRAAHKFLFVTRHPQPTPEFLMTFQDACHDAGIPRVVAEGFRGCGKTTTVEEVFVVKAAFGDFKNGLIVAESETRALERLAAIKNEFMTNDRLIQLFGDLKGPVWSERKIELSNGVVIQARGRGQDIRGTKHHDQRPDFILMDDVESDESCATQGAIRKLKQWIFKTLLPAGSPDCRVIWIGNRLSEDSVLVEVSKDPDWKHLRFPAVFINDQGEREAAWPERFPLEWIDAQRAGFLRLGILRDFMQEFMCESGAAEEQAFTSEMLRVVPRARTWEPVYCMFDPARTINRASARTGFAAWSWIGPKLVVWRSWGRLLMPNEVIEQIFHADSEYRPVLIGVEKDGLNEWLEQPLRQEQVKRGAVVPYRAVLAPKEKSKLSFIKGLQPYFNAREVEFAEEMPDLREQLLSIPAGQNDIANALAFALRLRPGSPIYDDFTVLNVAEDIVASHQKPMWLALNATRAYTTAVLIQYGDGMKILADWVEDGEPAQVVTRILAQANLETGQPVRTIGGPQHFDQWNNVGLRQALAQIPATLARGGANDKGREDIRRLLKEQHRGRPALLVSSRARWTLNALSGGYARDPEKGHVTDTAREGIYRTLMEGVESFAALLRVQEDRAGEELNAVTRDGRQYRSARVR